MEKLTFALVTVAYKLKSYFQAHTVIVLTDMPLRRAMRNPKAAERMTLQAIELSEFDIQYQPHSAIKGQVVTDFIVQFTNEESQEVKQYPQQSVHIDGLSNQQAEGAGILLCSPEGDKIECMVHLDFPTTNNEAEYEAMVAGLDIAKVVRAASMVIHCNS